MAKVFQHLFITLLALASTTPVLSAQRIALVIGNSDYPQKLPNPVRDAESIKSVLQGYDFDVLYYPNVKTKEELEQAVDQFAQRSAGKELSLFYYSGHGVQRGGENFLMPTKAKIDEARQIKYRAMNLNYVLDAVRPAHAELNLVILDACRNDPYPRDERSASARGLARILEPPSGSIIAYSTSPGKTADDGDSQHSPYTQALLHQFQNYADKSILDVLNDVGIAVEDHTQGKQSPRFEPSPLRKKFCLAGCGRQPIPTPAEKIETKQAATDTQLDEAIRLYKQFNFSQALPLFKNAAEVGNLRAMAYLGRMYLKGQGLVKDEKEALRWIRQAADQHDGLGMASIGLMYAKGQGGLVKDENEAVRWFRRAVDAGDISGMTSLGVAYVYGKGGLVKDEKEAVRWFRQTADAGQGQGMYNLGVMYASGKGGLVKDEKEAVRWYRLAADAGEGSGMTYLGVAYAKGHGGLAKDDKEAVRWFRRAVDAGEGSGMTYLGAAYAKGQGGLAKDEKEAVRWYRQAADAGEGLGMTNLGAMYENGKGGLVKDEKEAIQWYRKGAELGNEYAKKRLYELEKR